MATATVTELITVLLIINFFDLLPIIAALSHTVSTPAIFFTKLEFENFPCILLSSSFEYV
jgi:hypothetical protein